MEVGVRAAGSEAAAKDQEAARLGLVPVAAVAMGRVAEGTVLETVAVPTAAGSGAAAKDLEGARLGLVPLGAEAMDRVVEAIGVVVVWAVVIRAVEVGSSAHPRALLVVLKEGAVPVVEDKVAAMEEAVQAEAGVEAAGRVSGAAALDMVAREMETQGVAVKGMGPEEAAPWW